MDRRVDQLRPNPFDELRFRSSVKPPVFHPASRAQERRVENIVSPMDGLRDIPGFDQGAQKIILLYALAAGKVEYDRVQALSETTAANQVDEVFADIQGRIAIEPISVAERQRKIGRIHRARISVRTHVDYARDWARRDARDERHLGVMAEEQAIHDHYPTNHHSWNVLTIEGGLVGFVFSEFKLGRTNSYEEFKGLKKSKFAFTNHPNLSDCGWYSLIPTKLEGVYFTLYVDTRGGKGREELSAEMVYGSTQMKENYRWFDTTKPPTTPPF
ncbi:MAG TPA: hypothetical protein VJG66_02765 [Patescibacteria group bacterium]|nr:hypothetical protein [Patescibacteria group bacterium]